MEKKKKGDVNEGKYLEKEKIFFVDEKEENIWRRKVHSQRIRRGRTFGHIMSTCNYLP